jgi:hypothetical protein
MSKFVCLSREADTLVDEVQAQNLPGLQRGTQTTRKNLKPGNFFPGGPKWGIEDAVFFRYIDSDGKTRTIAYKEAL